MKLISKLHFTNISDRNRSHSFYYLYLKINSTVHVHYCIKQSIYNSMQHISHTHLRIMQLNILDQNVSAWFGGAATLTSSIQALIARRCKYIDRCRSVCKAEVLWNYSNHRLYKYSCEAYEVLSCLWLRVKCNNMRIRKRNSNRLKYSFRDYIVT